MKSAHSTHNSHITESRVSKSAAMEEKTLDVMVSLDAPIDSANQFDMKEAMRLATEHARRRLVDWLSERGEEFTILPEEDARPISPLFVVRSTRRIVEDLLNSVSRPTFVQAAEPRYSFSTFEPTSDDEMDRSGS